MTRNPPYVRYVSPLDTTCDNDSHLLTSLPFYCVNESGNNLGIGGIKALVPALTQMPHLTTLNIQGKSRVLRLHDGVCWLGTSE